MILSDSCNIADLISKQASCRPDAIAIYSGEDRLSYKELDLLVWKTATVLYEKGVRRSDVVAHMFDDELTLLISIFSTARLGATVFSVPVSTPVLLRKEMLNKVKAKFIATDIKGFTELSLEKIRVNKELFSQDKVQVNKHIKEPCPVAPWLLITGSGTTGKAKLIPLTHAQVMSRIRLNQTCIPIDQEDVITTFVHLDYSVGKLRCLDAFFSGSAYMLFDRGKTDPIEMVKKYGVTILHSTVFHVENILKRWKSGDKRYFNGLKVLAIGSSTVTDDLRARIIEKLTSRLYILYGTNEFSPIAVFDSQTMPVKEMTLGHIISGVHVEIVDAMDSIVPTGEVGNIRIKNPGVIEGYYGDQDATDKYFKDGWFYPGDLGKFCDDGQLIYYGREDHMMIMNGINIYPAEIEAVLTQHPYVTDAVTMPIKHPVHQDIPVCAVVLQKGSSISIRELMDFSYQRLGSKGPKEIVVLDAIPRNEQGKLIRAELAESIVHTLSVKREQSKKTVLVMFSGGLDSTYMLYHYLVNTDYKIHVHHISMRYPSEPRWEEEDFSSRKIVDYCRKIRPFDYSESRVDIGFYKYVGRDSDTQLLMASKVAPNLKGEVYLALGWQNSDHQDDLRNGRAQNRVTQKLWEALCESMGKPFNQNVSRTILLPLIEMKLEKKQMITRLPKELLQMTWSCRRPLKDDRGISRPCGECHPCIDIKDALSISMP